MQIRAESPGDEPAIHALNRSAFDSAGEADLVATLRHQADVISLVAEDKNQIVGHILFSPVTLTGHESLPLAGLAPMAVLPDRQRTGIGSDLIRAGLDACHHRGFVAVVVLGHPEYYPRFGFRRASEFNLACEFEVPDEAFMAIELESGALRHVAGTVHYHQAFRTI